MKDQINFLRKRYPEQKDWLNAEQTELAADDTIGDVYDAVKIINKLLEVVEMQYDAIEKIHYNNECGAIGFVRTGSELAMEQIRIKREYLML
jgi:hypothetical protein